MVNYSCTGRFDGCPPIKPSGPGGVARPLPLRPPGPARQRRGKPVPEFVQVCRLGLKFTSVNLSECTFFPVTRNVGLLPDGSLAYSHEAFAVKAVIEKRLTGERTAPLWFLGCKPRTGGLWRDQSRDLWFIEVTKSSYLGEKPKYAELSRDEASSWLAANRYEPPDATADHPSVSRPAFMGKPVSTPWLHSLSELRPRFVARIDDDLHLLAVNASMPCVVTESDAAVEMALALPYEGGWLSGKPIIRDDRPDWFADREDAATRIYYSRYVLFGTADGRSVAEFDRLAEIAGRYVNNWQESTFMPTGRERLKPHADNGWHECWLSYIVSLAGKRIPGCRRLGDNKRYPERLPEWYRRAALDVAQIVPIPGVSGDHRHVDSSLRHQSEDQTTGASENKSLDDREADGAGRSPSLARLRSVAKASLVTFLRGTATQASTVPGGLRKNIIPRLSGLPTR